MSTHARIERQTSESKVLVEVDLDGTGRHDVSTGVGFYDHMLISFARHALVDLVVQTEGDTHIDAHHTVEDTAIVLGQALREALGDKAGIRRFGDATVPLDEALVQAVVDVSGALLRAHRRARGPAVRHARRRRYLGSLTRHVFETLAFHAHIALHVRVLAGREPHHIVETQFKAFARAFRDAVALDPRETGVPRPRARSEQAASSSSTTARGTSAPPCARSSGPAPTVDPDR
jgi:imidazoleglycerol-phosphate dehydratase